MAFFKVTQWGPSVGVGATGAIYAHVSAVCKKNSPQCAYVVPNELVAAEIGRILRLPVPPGFIVQDTNQIPHYSSLDFNLTGAALPPVIPAQFIQVFQPDLGAIIVFDVLIANPDRHNQNLSADYSNPPRFNIFDHSHALLGGGGAGSGLQHLQAAANALVVGQGHVAINGVNSEALLVQAIERVESLPNYFIPSVVDEATQFGLTAAEGNGLKTFLQDRRSRVRTLISNNKQLFPAIHQWQVL